MSLPKPNYTMTKQYCVAGNAFEISVPDGLVAWEGIKNRFEPFASSNAEKPVLTINIHRAVLAPVEAELIYGPVSSDIGIISASAYRESDGTLIMQFDSVKDQCTRIQMSMPSTFDRAEIEISQDEDPNDLYILAHATMIAFMIATSANGSLVIHSSCVRYKGKAYLFQGKSGTGKSTHASLWLKNIPGAELLNDDHPIIRISEDGPAIVYGSPWSGKTHCYRNVCAPIGAFVRIVRAKENELRSLPPLQGYASLTASVFFLPFLNEAQRAARHKTIEQLAMTVPCCEMHCSPDAEAAIVCRQGLQD